MHDFTPVSALAGGALIAASLALMLITTGRVAGLSGVLAGFLRVERGDWGWRAWFLVGMLGAGAIFAAVRPETFDRATAAPLWLVAVSGVVVGIGTRLGNGCTSGHGLCGMSRLSRRSIVATLVFFAAGVITATVAGSVSR
jgi:uncharacterized membrane protein YedE/YeeE